MPSPPAVSEDETALVSAAQADPQEFAALYERYVQPVYRYFHSRLGGDGEAEEMTAQTFLRALEALPRYRHRGHFGAWLFAIARNLSIDHFRQEKEQLPLGESHPAEDADPLAQVVHAEQVERLAGLFRDLGDDEQELVRLRYAAGLSFAEISILLGRKEDAVKKSLYRLLARLQGRLEASHE